MSRTYERPVHDLRNNYSARSQILRDKDHIIITNNGQEENVLINIDECQQFKEYLHVKYIKEKLAEAKKQANNPSTQ